MDSWRHHQRQQQQQQKVSPPTYRAGGQQYAVPGANVMPSGGDRYSDAGFNSLSAVEEYCNPPPLKSEYNLKSQETAAGQLSEQVVLPYAPQLEQQFFSGFNPCFVRECRRTVSSEYVIKYKDGTALKAGFSYHEPSCKCQECVARFFPEFDNKTVASVSKPAYLGDKNVGVQEAIFPKPAGISDERYIPVHSSFSKPAGINSEGCVPKQTGVSKPSVRCDPEHIAMLCGVSKPTDINNEGCIAMQTGVSKASVCSDVERVAMSGDCKPIDSNSEGCVTTKTKVSSPCVPSDPERGALLPASIEFQPNVSEHPDASKPAKQNDLVSVIRLWKPLDADSNRFVPKHSGASVPADLSNKEKYVAQLSISESKELSSQGYHVIPSNFCIPREYIDRETLEQSEASRISNRECHPVEPTEGLINQQIYDTETELEGKEKLYHRTQSYEQLSIQPVTDGERVEGEKPFKCAMCSMSFASKAWLARHSFVHGPVYCRLCEKPFLSISALNLHKAEHRKEGKMTVRSSISKSKDLNNESSLIIPSGHIDRETFVEQSKASKISNNSNNVDGLINEQVNDQQTQLALKEKVYSKTQISHELLSNQTVTNVEEVEGDKPFKCTKCSMTFASRTWRSRHFFTHGPVHCRICDKPFLSASTLKEHKAEHRKNGKKTAQSSMFKSNDLSNESSFIQSNVSIPSDHVDRETFKEQSIASRTSNKGCNVGGLINHLIYDELTQLAVKGEVHPRTQSSRELFSNQIVTNGNEVEGDKPFKCTMCDMTFRHKAWFTRHSFVHGPVHCRICDKPFSSLSTLKEHKAEHCKKGKKTAQSSISQSKDPSNESSLFIPSNVSIPSGDIDRETFMEQSKASKISNKGSNVAGIINDQQTQVAVKEKAYPKTQSSRGLLSNQTVTNAEDVEGDNAFRCTKCSLTFTSKTCWRRHAFAHGPVHCRICDKPFFSVSTLKEHVVEHQWKGNETAESSKDLSNESSLITASNDSIPSGHIDRETFMEQSEVSQISNKGSNVDGLINQWIHDQETELAVKKTTYHRIKQFPCRVCGKTFLSWPSWNGHMTKHRKERNRNIGGLINQQIYDQQTQLAVKEKAYPKTQSSRGLLSSQTVTNVEEVEGDKPFKCTKCSMTFASRTWRSRHSFTHGPVHCRICDKPFLSISTLKEHMVQHRKNGKKTAQSSISGDIDIESSMEQSKASKLSNKGSNVGGLINQQMFGQQTEIAAKEKAYHRTQSLEVLSNQTVTNVEEVEGDKPFKCTKCSMTFVSETWLKRHSRAHTNPYLCRVCDKTFLSWASWNGHMTKHRKEGKRIFKCRQCSEVFFSAVAAYKHKLSHKEDNFQCNVCNEPFGTHSEYLAHVNVHRTPPKSARPPKPTKSADIGTSYPCDQCDKVCSRIHLLKKHKRVHLKGRLECVVCKKVFKFRSDLTRHSQRHRNILCQDCDIMCASITEYKEHLKTHQQTRRLKCVLCGAFFLTKHALAAHLMQHKKPKVPQEPEVPQEPKELQEPKKQQEPKEVQEPKLFRCPQCNIQCATKRKLAIHMMSHSQTKYYKCKECSKKFTSQSKLRTHEGIHFEVKTFHCSICRKGFSTNTGLEGHMKAHRKKFFSCAECDATFERSEDLKEHTLTHPKDRSSKCMVCDLLFRATELFRCNLISSEEEAPFECLLCEACFNNNITNAQDRPSAV
ncbi:zinc finger protein 91 [Anabrus simplex]|uniref:zinc finger protein 91 n=1 Tax=Anabrus simplex TaxID=316456 RepID=UPI0035A35A16